MEAVLYVYPSANPDIAEKQAANTSVGNEAKQEAQHWDS